jgi:hypothetical protein
MKGRIRNREGLWIIEFVSAWDCWAIPGEIPLAPQTLEQIGEREIQKYDGKTVDFKFAYYDSAGREFNPLKENCPNCVWYGKVIETENDENHIP